MVPGRPPYVPGAGVADTVGSLGPATDLGCAGQRVVADTPEHGGYLERARVPVERLILVPDRLDLEAAAALLH